ncbi:MAG TPA: TonB-dependent receptor [Candidatus Marinimicrobia bacterium]|nr:TonB-dependent receptor [Candidatus Neomarinimicrobiota bacterium]
MIQVRYFSLILFLSILTNANQPVFKDTLKVFPFDPVVVTGTRVEMPLRELPFSISQISERIIEEQTHVPLLDLVSENVPGLFVTRRTNIGYGVASGAAGGISIRGVGGNPTTGVLVLIDGRPDIMGVFGHPLSDAYLFYAVKEIEVMRGPASLLYGSNAMGGAINIITEHEREKGYHVQLPLRYGSYNTGQFTLHQSYGSDKWNGALSTSYRNSDGYRTKGRDDYTSKSGNLEARYFLSSAAQMTLNGYFSDYLVYDPGQISAPISDHWYDILRYGGDLTFNHAGKQLESDLKVHYNAGDHMIHDDDDFSADTANYTSTDYTLGLVFNETWHYAEKSRLTAGFDFRKYGGDANIRATANSSTIYQNDVKEISGLINVQHQLLNSLFVNGGLRYTTHTTAGEWWIPAAGFSWLLPRQWTLKVQYAEGYRNPTIKDLYLFNPANENLLPETSQNIEMSVEKRYRGFLNTALTVYNTKVANLIVPAFVPSLGRPLNQNSGTAEIKGAEIEGQLLLPPSFVINWSAGYSAYSEILTGSPELKMNLGIRYQPLKPLRLTLQAEYIDGLYSDDNPYDYALNPVRLDDYFLLDFRGSYDLSKYFSLFAEVKNLLDREYETMAGFPMPGINFTLGITARY